MDSATDTVSLKTKIYVSVASIVDVVLVEHVVQALIQVIQVEQDHCSASLHTNLDLVDVPTNLV